MAEILAAGISRKFLWTSGKSGFHFISFLVITVSWFSKSKMLSTIRGITKAVILFRMRWKADKRRNKTNKMGKGEKPEALAGIPVDGI